VPLPHVVQLLDAVLLLTPPEQLVSVLQIIAVDTLAVPAGHANTSVAEQ
jgi:hypothetical protein